MPLDRSGRTSHKTPSVYSLGACRYIVKHAYKPVGATQDIEKNFELQKLNLGKMDEPATSFFHFDFWGVYILSPL